MTKYVSVERAKFRAEMCGAQYDSGYCEIMVDGRRLAVDIYLIRGWSSIDHLADRSISAVIEAIGGKPFRTKRCALRAAETAALGGPRLNIAISDSSLAARWVQRNIA